MDDKKPLPPDLAEQLQELRECGNMIYDTPANFNRQERARLNKLRALGLVQLAWVTTEAGRKEE